MIELKVDEDMLVRRIASRVAEMAAMKLAIRDDDKPEVLRQRLSAYRAQTAPLVAYYRQKGALKSVDGMAPIETVTTAVNRALADAAFGAVPAKRAAGKAAAPKEITKKAAKKAPEGFQGPSDRSEGRQEGSQGHRPEGRRNGKEGVQGRQESLREARPEPGGQERGRKAAQKRASGG